MDTNPALAALLDDQDGVVTRAQLLDIGVTAAAVRWNAGRSWRVLLPGVFAWSREMPTARQRLRAGLLWAGDLSVLAGPTAARLHGVTSADPGGTVHLLVPAPRRSRSTGFAVVRRTRLHDRSTARGGLRVSSPARSVVDAARAAASTDARTAIMVEAVQRRIVHLDDLAEWVHRLRPRDSAVLRGPLAAVASGAWSVPEDALLHLVAGSSVLPTPWANPRLLDPADDPLTSPDVWFDDVALAVMVHSRRHHGEGDDWDDTVDSDAGLTAAGVVVVGVTPRRIRRQPERVLRRLEEAYAVAQRRPRPAVRAIPRSPWALATAQKVS